MHAQEIAARLRALASEIEGQVSQAPTRQTPAAPSPMRPPPRGEIHLIPGGREKGTPLDAATDDALNYWADRIDQQLRDGSGDPRYRTKNQALLQAIRAEQDRRFTA